MVEGRGEGWLEEGDGGGRWREGGGGWLEGGWWWRVVEGSAVECGGVRM